MASQASALRQVDNLPPPPELASELRHLPGLIFLDSSSIDPESQVNANARFSLITACPESIHEGSLFDSEDRSKLQYLFHENRRCDRTSPDLGFPVDGLYGYVTYEGEFTFGLYRECLIYDHHTETWMETGKLSEKRLPNAAIQVPNAEPEVLFRFESSPEAFCHLVQRAQDYIASGDIYQVNLAHRLVADVDTRFDSFALFERLRHQSPAPFSSFLSLGGREVVSSSPEQFLSISGRTIQTRPIKGTRPRFRDRELDEKSAYDLITSTKEIAELIMITDLERNDLGQICEFGSVEATELLKLERFAQVFHLISTIEGTLRREIDHIAALHACYPGGSITGAPKKRAREIIAELEPINRGLYTGSIGCFGFNGESRFSIAIRTVMREADQLHFHVGAGIVADSVPEKEWEETLHKAAGIFRATQGSG
ncbi:MAG: chorismate-binding protein [Verrucomicrobiota bacterium]